MGIKRILNAPLKKGDRVELIKMTDPYKIPPTMVGTVKRVVEAFGSKMYEIDWYTKSGKKVGNLSLIDEIDPETGKKIDSWFKLVDEDEEKNNDDNIPIDNIDEHFVVLTKKDILKEASKSIPQKFVDLSKYYNLGKIHKYLDELRKSGVINMWGASPYLWMGKERIEHKHHYDELSDENQESFDYVLDNAEDIKNMLISGAMKKNEGNEDDDVYYLKKVGRTVENDSKELHQIWMKMKSGSKFMK